MRFRRKDLISLLVAVAIGYGVSQWLLRSAPIGRDVSANPLAQTLLRDTQSPSRDVASPTLTLVVFTDYQCPACRQANSEMDAAVAQDGRVRVIYRDWPVFGPMSERAARVVIASDRQRIYPAVHSRVMNSWHRADDTLLREAVEMAGGNWDTLLNDLKVHGPEIDAQIVRNKADAFAIGVRASPTYLAGTRLARGRLDEAGFKRLFAEARDR
ncbi:MAG: DsbA family protein [Pseudomonadota bacterium]